MMIATGARQIACACRWPFFLCRSESWLTLVTQVVKLGSIEALALLPKNLMEES
jgi:hypothetical protein